MRFSSAFLVMACGCPLALASEAYSNLGPCNGVNSFSGALSVWPSLLFGYHEDTAAQFTATAGGTGSVLRLPITSQLGPDVVTLRLFASNGTALGAQIGSGVELMVDTAADLFASPLLIVDIGEAGWTFVAGQKYWLGVSAPINSGALFTVWQNTQDDVGRVVYIDNGVVDSYSNGELMPAFAIELGPSPACVAPGIAIGPSPASTCRFGSATFTLQPSGTGPFITQWQALLTEADGGGWANLGDGNFVVSDVTNPGHNMVAGTVACAGGVSMTFSPNPNFARAFETNQLEFRCVVSNTCGSTPSQAVTLTVCPADLDDDGDLGDGGHCDGGVDINDLLYFLSAFELGASGADIDNDGVEPQYIDGGVDINDLLYFLVHFEAGC